MLAIIKNDWNRLIEQKAQLIIAVVLTVISVASAVFLTTNIQMKQSIAIVDESNKFILPHSKYLNLTMLKEEPPMSELVQNRYDAVIHVSKKGEVSIKSIKSEELKDKIKAFINNPNEVVLKDDSSRKIGTNIIGYMMLFLLIQGVLFARLFAEDKEKHMTERIAISPIPFKSYLLGHSIFMTLMIFIPSFSVIIVAKLIGVNIGLSLLQFGFLIGVLSILGTSFAVFLNSLFCVEDTANMIGSTTLILTSILAGSFYSFTKGDGVFNKLLNLLPQKDFINFVDALERGRMTTNIEIGFGYVIALIIVMFAFAVLKTRRDYVYSK